MTREAGYRQKQYDERRKEREARDKEEDPEEFVKVPTHAWAEELFIVQDLIKYCKKQVPKVAKEASATASAKKAFDPAAHKAGLIPIGKGIANSEDDDFAHLMGPKSKKGGKGGAKGAASPAAASEPKAVEDKKLSLSMDAFAGFHTVGVQPPVMASQCAATIQALQAAKVRIQKLTAEDKTKQKAENAAQAKAQKDAKKASSKSSSGKESSGIPTAEVSESTIDFRKAIKGVHGAHM